MGEDHGLTPHVSTLSVCVTRTTPGSVRPGGTATPMVTGASRVGTDPLVWVAQRVTFSFSDVPHRSGESD